MLGEFDELLLSQLTALNGNQLIIALTHLTAVGRGDEPPLTEDQVLRLASLFEGTPPDVIQSVLPAQPAPKSSERIACSAIHVNDGVTYASQPVNITTGMVFCGLRHFNCFPAIHKAFLGCTLPGGSAGEEKQVQGFVTTHNRFVDRDEALAIARAAGQQLLRGENITWLSSEDLW